MTIPSSLGYKYAMSFSARKRPYYGQCVFSEVVLFTVPLSDASAWRDFLNLVSSEFSSRVAFDVGVRSDSLPSGGWVFAIYDGHGFRFFGVASIESSITFFHSFYRQFEGLDDFGFYDSYHTAPILGGF